MSKIINVSYGFQCGRASLTRELIEELSKIADAPVYIDPYHDAGNSPIQHYLYIGNEEHQIRGLYGMTLRHPKVQAVLQTYYDRHAGVTPC